MDDGQDAGDNGVQTMMNNAAWATALLIALGAWSAAAREGYGPRSTAITVAGMCIVAQTSALGANLLSLRWSKTTGIEPAAMTALTVAGALMLAALGRAAQRTATTRQPVRRAIANGCLVTNLEVAIGAPVWLVIKSTRNMAGVETTPTTAMLWSTANAWATAWTIIAITSLNGWLAVRAVQARSRAKRTERAEHSEHAPSTSGEPRQREHTR